MVPNSDDYLEKEKMILYPFKKIPYAILNPQLSIARRVERRTSVFDLSFFEVKVYSSQNKFTLEINYTYHADTIEYSIIGSEFQELGTFGIEIDEDFYCSFFEGLLRTEVTIIKESIGETVVAESILFNDFRGVEVSFFTRKPSFSWPWKRRVKATETVAPLIQSDNVEGNDLFDEKKVT